jgi:hypothetical protein
MADPSGCAVGSMLARIVVSNLPGGMIVCLLWVLCIFSRGLLVGLITYPRESWLVCACVHAPLKVIVKPWWWGLGPLGAVMPKGEKKYWKMVKLLLAAFLYFLVCAFALNGLLVKLVYTFTYTLGRCETQNSCGIPEDSLLDCGRMKVP